MDLESDLIRARISNCDLVWGQFGCSMVVEPTRSANIEVPSRQTRGAGRQQGAGKQAEEMKTQATYDGTSKSTQICPVSRFLCEINQNTLGITTQSKCHNKQVSPPAEVYQIYA
jgi:hypothetical protein